eukprot:scaffold4605_cov48-Phaeocystis_antarctica.AAC.2
MPSTAALSRCGLSRKVTLRGGRGRAIAGRLIPLVSEVTRLAAVALSLVRVRVRARARARARLGLGSGLLR